MWGSLMGRSDSLDPTSLPQGTQAALGVRPHERPSTAEVRGLPGGEQIEEGEGTKFESALLTLPGKVCLGAQQTEKG